MGIGVKAGCRGAAMGPESTGERRRAEAVGRPRSLHQRCVGCESRAAEGRESTGPRVPNVGGPVPELEPVGSRRGD